MKPQPYDVLIIGAGINGAGLFRDLCEQGVSCAIVDKADFGSGTSAAPSRLIHGGLKYLETGEFGLVAQSTLERNLLLKNAPHLVSPLPTIIPIFSWFKGIGASLRTLLGSTTTPRSRGAFLVKVGLSIYDYYGSRHGVMPRHTMMSKKRALRDMPKLTKSIVATGIYHDAKIHNPERLVFELISDGLAANDQSYAANYATFAGLSEGVLSYELKSTTIKIKPKILINAAGPWIDHVNQQLGAITQLIGGTKGSHILLGHAELVKNLDGRMIYFEGNDGRVCLVFEYLGQALVGSTDIPDRDPDGVTCDEAEIDYMLDSLRQLLPEMSFDRDQITYVYSGIRPLPASDSKNPGLISRDHSSPLLEPTQERSFSITSLVGGKWTTFRGFAEEVADQVLERLDRKRRLSTQSLPIGGGLNFPLNTRERTQWVNEVSQSSGLTHEAVDLLLTRYGTTAKRIAHHQLHSQPCETLPNSDYTTQEIDFIVRNEWVESLLDVVLRRTDLAITNALSIESLKAIAEIAAKSLGWDDNRKVGEINNALDYLKKRNFMRL